MVSQWNSSGIFPRNHTIAALQKIQEFFSKMSEEPEDFTGRVIFMLMFNDISWGSKDNEKECELSAKLVSIHAKRFSPGRWSFLGPGSEKKWYSSHDSKPQREWDRVAELMMLKFGESKNPVLRSTSPLSRGKLKSKRGGKMSKHFCVQLFLLISRVLTEQSQICVKNAKPAMLKQGDLFWWDNLTHCLCPQE